MKKEDQAESKFKNTRNAEHNYNYFVKHQYLVKKSINVHVHNGRFETVTNPETGESDALWTVTEPIHVTFSWKDKNNNNAFPLSFHDDTNKFEDMLNTFCHKKMDNVSTQESLKFAF